MKALAIVTLVSLCACAPDVDPAPPRDRVDGGSVDGGVVSVTDSGAGCAGDLTECSGTCVDTSRDFAHCGGCDVQCGPMEVCNRGGCARGACPVGTTNCGGSCLDTSADPAHCGSCERACAAGETCDAGACGACGTGTSFAADVLPIFTSTCGGMACHQGMRPAANLSLEASRAYAELVGVPSSCPSGTPLVSPGDPDGSYLVHKITGVGLCGGNRMPLGGRALTSAQIATIRDWICGGARND